MEFLRHLTELKDHDEGCHMSEMMMDCRYDSEKVEEFDRKNGTRRVM